MDTTTLMWLGGIAAAIAAGWSQIKGVLSAVAGRVVVTHKLDRWLAHPVSAHLHRNARCITTNNAEVVSQSQFLRPLGRSRRVAFLVAGRGAALFLLRGRPLWFKPHQWTGDGGTITFIRGTVDIGAIIEAALEEEQSYRLSGTSKRFRVRHIVGKPKQELSLIGGQSGEGPATPPDDDRWHESIPIGYGKDPIGWDADDIGEPTAPDPGHHLVLDAEQERVFAEVANWLASSEWYRRRNLKWRRGYLLHGPAGTGKTSTVKALAQRHDLPVWSFDLASLSNQEFIREWQRMLAEAPVVALFEDIDAVFNGRTNIVPEHTSGGLTFDCLLNMLDGVEETNGVLSFVTTNRLDQIDPALANRPGRIDRAVLFDRFTFPQLFQYVTRVFDGEPDGDELAQEALSLLSAPVSPAQAQEVCLGILQRRAGSRLSLVRQAAG